MGFRGLGFRASCHPAPTSSEKGLHKQYPNLVPVYTRVNIYHGWVGGGGIIMGRIVFGSFGW